MLSRAQFHPLTGYVVGYELAWASVANFLTRHSFHYTLKFTVDDVILKNTFVSAMRDTTRWAIIAGGYNRVITH
jgi:hypothetical protein